MRSCYYLRVVRSGVCPFRLDRADSAYPNLLPLTAATDSHKPKLKLDPHSYISKLCGFHLATNIVVCHYVRNANRITEEPEQRLSPNLGIFGPAGDSRNRITPAFFLGGGTQGDRGSRPKPSPLRSLSRIQLRLALFFPNAEVTINPALLVLLGLVVGTLGGFFGVGGGFLITGGLLVFGVPPLFAVGTGLTLIMGSSIINTLKHRRLGHVDYKLGLLMVCGTIPACCWRSG